MLFGTRQAPPPTGARHSGLGLQFEDAEETDELYQHAQNHSFLRMQRKRASQEKLHAIALQSGLLPAFIPARKERSPEQKQQRQLRQLQRQQQQQPRRLIAALPQRTLLMQPQEKLVSVQPMQPALPIAIPRSNDGGKPADTNMWGMAATTAPLKIVPKQHKVKSHLNANEAPVCRGVCFCGNLVAPSDRHDQRSTRSSGSSSRSDTPTGASRDGAPRRQGSSGSSESASNASSSSTVRMSAGSNKSDGSSRDGGMSDSTSPSSPLTPASAIVAMYHPLSNQATDEQAAELSARIQMLTVHEDHQTVLADDELDGSGMKTRLPGSLLRLKTLDADIDIALGTALEEDHESAIYCSTACARSDALAALLFGSEEDTSRGPARKPVCASTTCGSDGKSIIREIRRRHSHMRITSPLFPPPKEPLPPLPAARQVQMTGVAISGTDGHRLAQLRAIESASAKYDERSAASHYRRMEALAAASSADIFTTVVLSSPEKSAENVEARMIAAAAVDHPAYPESPLLYTDLGHSPPQRGSATQKSGSSASSSSPAESLIGFRMSRDLSSDTAATSIPEGGVSRSVSPTKSSRDSTLERSGRLQRELDALNEAFEATFGAFGKSRAACEVA